MTGADGIAVPWGGAGRAGVQAAGLAVLMRAQALVRRERTGVRADRSDRPDVLDPPIRDTLTGSRVVS